MIEKLYEGDMRYGTLASAVIDLLKDRAEGCPLPAILGVLDLVKDEVIREARGE